MLSIYLRYAILFGNLFIFCTLDLLVAQVTNIGQPKSWTNRIIGKSGDQLPRISMPGFDLKKLEAEDLKRAQSMSKTYRFGYGFDVHYTPQNSGRWDQLTNGDWIWRLRIHSENANTLNFIFDIFKIPDSASLYLYSLDRSDLLGAYTSDFNRKDLKLGTWLVLGDDVVLEYYVPANAKGKEKLRLSRVIHGYRAIGTSNAGFSKNLNFSGSCNVDVDCEVGDDFDPLKDQLKRTIALILINEGANSCSGTLITTVAQDRKPYLLTANHCYEDTFSQENGLEGTNDPAEWAFRFNWVSPNPNCAAAADSTDGNFNQTTSGATILAQSRETDFLLLQIDTNLPTSWELEFAGWNRSSTSPSFAVGLHHPNGDIMKISRDNNSLAKVNQVQVSNLIERIDVWRVNNWEIGVTEKGSSGSALFNPQGQIIGQLAGGSAQCMGLVNNGRFDLYGRFDLSWNTGTTKASRLSDWLDPEGTNAMFANGTSKNSPQEFFLYPNPSEKGIIRFSNIDLINLVSYSVYDLFGRFISETSISDSANGIIDLTALASGVYFILLKDNNGKITQKKVSLY